MKKHWKLVVASVVVGIFLIWIIATRKNSRCIPSPTGKVVEVMNTDALRNRADAYFSFGDTCTLGSGKSTMLGHEYGIVLLRHIPDIFSFRDKSSCPSGIEYFLTGKDFDDRYDMEHNNKHYLRRQLNKARRRSEERLGASVEMQAKQRQVKRIKEGSK